MNEENVMTTNEQEERMPFFRIPRANVLLIGKKSENT